MKTFPEKMNPKIGEKIRNMGGNAYVKQIVLDTIVIAEVFGQLYQVKIIGRTAKNELCTN